MTTDKGWLIRAAASCVAALVLSASSLPAEDPPGPEETTAGETSIEPPEKKSERTVATSLTQTMEADSGLSVQTLCTNCNNADLSMGGLDNDHVAVTCDGLPVPSGLAQIYLLSVMPPTVIDKVAIKKGASEPQLSGGAVGGGIQIDRRRPEPGMELNFLTDGGGHGWRGSQFDVSGGTGRFGASFVGSWAKSKLVDAVGDGNPNLPSFERYTLDGSAEVRLTQTQRFRVRANRYDESQEDGPAAYDFLATLFSGTTKYNRENVELERSQYDALYEGQFDDGSRLEVSLVAADRSQDVEETASVAALPLFYFPTYLIDDAHVHSGLSWSRPFGQQGMMRAGMSYEDANYDIVDINYNGFQGLQAGFTLEEDVEEWGVWVEGESAIGGNVDLSVGLRFVAFDYVDNEAEVAALVPARVAWLSIPLPDGDRLLPRAAVTWKPTDVVTLRLSAGTGFRAPEPIFDEVCCGRKYRNNRGMQMEKSESFGLEVTFQPAPTFRVGGSVFVNDFEDRIIRIASLANAFRATYQNVNVPKARYENLSLDTSWQPNDWFSVKGSVSWLEADNRTSGDVIPVLIDFNNIPVSKEFTTSTIPFVTDRRGAVGVTFKPPGTGVAIAANAQYTGPKQIQEFVEGSAANPDLSFSEVEFDRFTESEDFWLTSINVSKAFSNGMAIFGGVDNLSNYVQSDLGDPRFDHNWGPLRGRYYYGGLSFHLERK